MRKNCILTETNNAQNVNFSFWSWLYSLPEWEQYDLEGTMEHISTNGILQISHQWKINGKDVTIYILVRTFLKLKYQQNGFQSDIQPFVKLKHCQTFRHQGFHKLVILFLFLRSFQYSGMTKKFQMAFSLIFIL